MTREESGTEKELPMKAPTGNHFFLRENKSLEEKHFKELQGFVWL